MKFIGYFVALIACLCIHASAAQNAVLRANQDALAASIGLSDAFTIRLLTQLNTALDKALMKAKCNTNLDCQEVVVFEVKYIIINSLLGNNPVLSQLNSEGWTLYGNKTAFYKQYANRRAAVRKIAYQVLQSQLDDGDNSYQPYVYSNAPYAWRSSANGNPNPVQNSMVNAYVIGNYKDAQQKYNVQPPLQPGSPDFLTQLNEVKTNGESSTVSANPQNKQTADLWNKDSPASRVANMLVQNVLQNQYGNDDSASYARTLRVVNTAVHDCLFFIYYLKTQYNSLRPSWFIHNGVPSVNGQPSLAADPSWQPYVSGDAQPGYPDTLAALSGGVSVLKQLFGSVSGPITYQSAFLSKTISYSSLQDIQNDMLSADIYAGTNFRYSNFGFANVCTNVAKDVAKAIKKNP